MSFIYQCLIHFENNFFVFFWIQGFAFVQFKFQLLKALYTTITTIYSNIYTIIFFIGDVGSRVSVGLWDRIRIFMPVVLVPRSSSFSGLQLSTVPFGPPHFARWTFSLSQCGTSSYWWWRTDWKVLRELLRK